MIGNIDKIILTNDISIKNYLVSHLNLSMVMGQNIYQKEQGKNTILIFLSEEDIIEQKKIPALKEYVSNPKAKCPIYNAFTPNRKGQILFAMLIKNMGLSVDDTASYNTAKFNEGLKVTDRRYEVTDGDIEYLRARYWCRKYINHTYSELIKEAESELRYDMILTPLMSELEARRASIERGDDRFYIEAEICQNGNTGSLMCCQNGAAIEFETAEDAEAFIHSLPEDIQTEIKTEKFPQEKGIKYVDLISELQKLSAPLGVCLEAIDNLYTNGQISHPKGEKEVAHISSDDIMKTSEAGAADLYWINSKPCTKEDVSGCAVLTGCDFEQHTEQLTGRILDILLKSHRESEEKVRLFLLSENEKFQFIGDTDDIKADEKIELIQYHITAAKDCRLHTLSSIIRFLKINAFSPDMIEETVDLLLDRRNLTNISQTGPYYMVTPVDRERFLRIPEKIRSIERLRSIDAKLQEVRKAGLTARQMASYIEEIVKKDTEEMREYNGK